MKNFFVDSKPYELPHILVLLFIIAIAVLLVTLTKVFVKKEKTLMIVIKITAGVVLFLAVLSRFVYNDFKPSFLDFMPNTFCSTMGFVLPLFVLFCKPNSKSLFFALFAGMMGGLITILSGDDIGQLRIQNTLISYLYHGLMPALAFLCFITKYCQPTLDKVPSLFVGLCVLATWGLFTNQVFNFSNNMFLNEPLIEGINWWICGLIIILIAIAFCIIYEAITRKWKDQNLYKAFTQIKYTFKKDK